MYARNSSWQEPVMARRTTRPELTPEQQAEADRIHIALVAATADDLRLLSEQLATTTDRTIFGANEFTVRNIVLGIGAKALETALEERKKGGTTGRAGAVPSAANRPDSSAGDPSRS
jgi:hypothetical protein